MAFCLSTNQKWPPQFLSLSAHRIQRQQPSNLRCRYLKISRPKTFEGSPPDNGTPLQYPVLQLLNALRESCPCSLHSRVLVCELWKFGGVMFCLCLSLQPNSLSSSLCCSPVCVGGGYNPLRVKNLYWGGRV